MSFQMVVVTDVTGLVPAFEVHMYQSQLQIQWWQRWKAIYAERLKVERSERVLIVVELPNKQGCQVQ
jgi:hypothetical protein